MLAAGLSISPLWQPKLLIIFYELIFTGLNQKVIPPFFFPSQGNNIGKEINTLVYRLVSRFIKTTLTHPAQVYNVTALLAGPLVPGVFNSTEFLFSSEVGWFCCQNVQKYSRFYFFTDIFVLCLSNDTVAWFNSWNCDVLLRKIWRNRHNCRDNYFSSANYIPGAISNGRFPALHFLGHFTERWGSWIVRGIFGVLPIQNFANSNFLS